MQVKAVLVRGGFSVFALAAIRVGIAPRMALTALDAIFTALVIY